MSQEEAILSALKNGERITPLIALERFGCMALSQRCTRLRQSGHPIVTTMIDIGNGKRVAEYSYGQ